MAKYKVVMGHVGPNREHNDVGAVVEYDDYTARTFARYLEPLVGKQPAPIPAADGPQGETREAEHRDPEGKRRASGGKEHA